MPTSPTTGMAELWKAMMEVFIVLNCASLIYFIDQSFGEHRSFHRFRWPVVHAEVADHTLHEYTVTFEVLLYTSSNGDNEAE